MAKITVGFLEFIRERGVVGLATGFIIGTSVSKVVTSFVQDIINPLVGLLIGGEALKQATLSIGSVKLGLGNFTAVLIDFLIITFVVYAGIKGLKLDRVDAKKEDKKKA